MLRHTDAASPSPKAESPAISGRETVISREIYRAGPLRDDFERLAHPGVPMADADVLSFLLKYFFASLYPGSEDHAVPLTEASTLLGRFYGLWSEEKSEGAVPLAGNSSAFPLRMLADLPRTAHIFRSVANISGEITTQYVMRYTPDVTEASEARQFRKIRVAVNLPNVQLRYRNGYYPFGVPQQ